jgi:hypothetical protein
MNKTTGRPTKFPACLQFFSRVLSSPIGLSACILSGSIYFFLTVSRKKGYIYSMQIKKFIFSHTYKFFIVCLFASSFVAPILALASERSFRHEIRGGLGWSQEVSNYLNYVSRAEENPAKSESSERSPQSITGTYTFFFSSITPQADLPIALWHFYQRSGKASLSFTLQPESKICNIHDDPALGYHRHTDIHEQHRNAHLHLEHYVLPQTGFSLDFDVLRTDDASCTQTRAGSIRTHRTGDNESLRQKYGVGVSHYLAENLNLRIGYALMDGEYRSRERGWIEETPTLVTRYYDDGELTGNHFSLQGEGIFHNNFLGVQGRYDFQSYHVEADYLPVLPDEELVVEPMLSDDDLAHHSFGVELSLYVGHQTTVRIDNTWAIETIQRTYKEFDQKIDYERQYIALHAGVEHYINSAFGILIGYNYLRRGGDVRIGDRHEAPSLATYDTRLRRHAVTIGVIGRF